MSDADLDAKVRDLCDGVLAARQADRLIDVCRNIEREPRASVIAEAARRVAKDAPYCVLVFFLPASAFRYFSYHARMRFSKSTLSATLLGGRWAPLT